MDSSDRTERPFDPPTPALTRGQRTEPGPRTSPTVPPASLAERFEVLGLLGCGGMGVVYRARDLRLGREVALKLLLDVSPEMQAMFRREARTLAALEHDHVVRLYDFGVAEEKPYLVMEYVRGAALSVRLSEGRPTIAEAARTARDVLRGVAAAHAQGIVHRDLKPANVFLEEGARSRAKVADFGLARSARADADPPRTATSAREGLAQATSVTDGGIMGTPGYMAPEQSGGVEVGPPADVYAWGVILHEMLTGQRLFATGDLMALFGRQYAGPPPAPSTVNPSVPHALDALVTRCLLPDPAARPDAEAALAELTAWMDGVRQARQPRPGVDLPVSPYKFLAHFEPADAPIFFGRDPEVLEMAGAVESATRLLLVFGPCGVGKSSLLRAGLVPALDPARFETLVLSPGPDAARHAIAALVDAAGHRLEEVEASPRRLLDAVTQLARFTGKTLVLVLDQLEEVFTQNPRGSPRPAELFRMVELLVDSGAPVKVVLSYRTEFRGDFFPLEERLGRQARTLAVREVNRAGLIEAIEGPSRLPGYHFAFSDDLPERLAADILAGAQQGGDKALPVLQIVCRQLFERMRAKGQHRIDTALYEGALGGTRGALERYVEERLAGPEYASRGAMARQLLKALTVKEEAGERFSRASDEEELLDFPDREGARLTLERLLSDHLVIREASGGRRRVRLASEVICGVVDGWAVEPDEAERAARILSRARRQWDEQGRRDDDLLRGGALALVERQLGALKDVSAPERELVARAQAARSRRHVRAGLLALALACVTGGLAWAAFLRPGTVVLTTFPSGAQVSHDGQPLGTTPLRWTARPGRYQLEVSRDRYTTMGLEVHVPAGGEAAYQPILPYPFGTLSLDTVPAGATATVRRVGAGGAGGVVSVQKTPFTTELPEGAYLVALASKGWVTQTLADLHVLPNRENTRQSVVLEKDTGFLMVHTPWAGTEVTVVDAATQAQVHVAMLPMKTPVELPVGHFVARCAGPQHRSAEQAVEIRRGATCDVTAWVPVAEPMWVYPQMAQQSSRRTPDGAAPPPGGPGQVAPAVLGELDDLRGPDVVVCQQDGRLVAIAGSNGRELWNVDLGSPLFTAAALTDLDGDTHPDVVAVTAAGTVHAREGKRGGPLWQAELGAPSRSTPVCADLNGDSVEDVVVGAQDGSLTALSGADGAVLWKRALGAPVRAAVALADLDGDRVPDVVVAQDDGTVSALRGRDGSTLWRFSAGSPVHGAPLLAQLDNRPGLEVVFGAVDGRVHALSGATGAVLWTAKCGPVEAACASADLDGDGAADVIVPCMDHSLRALSGFSGRELWKAKTMTPLPFGVATVRLDGDAYPDVVVTAPEPYVRVYSGRDGRLIRTVPTVGPPLQSAPAIGDLNSNGMPDVVARGPFDTTAAIPLDAEDHDWAYQFAEGPMPADFRPPWVVTADLDGDEYPDPVLGAGDARVIAFRGRDHRVMWEHRDPDRVPLAPTVADLDGDGLTELIFISMKGEAYALAPKDGHELWRIQLGDQPGVPVALADLDGDGVPDLIFGLRGRVRAFSGASRMPLWSHALGADNPLTIVPGDVDRDGRPELAITLMSRRVALLDGRDGHERWSVEGGGHLQVTPTLPDVDGDHAADVVAITEDGVLTAFHGATGRVLWRVSNVAGRARPIAGDLDGDGADDIVTATLAGPVMAFNGRTGRKMWQADAGVEVADLQLLDLDGDGRLDVFAQSMLGKFIGLSGQGGPAHFLDDVFVMGALPVAFADPTTFRHHRAILTNSGRAMPALPRTRGPDLEMYSIRLSCALVKSRLPWPISFTRWGAESDVTSTQRRWVMPPPVVPRRKPRSAIWPWPAR